MVPVNTCITGLILNNEIKEILNQFGVFNVYSYLTGMVSSEGPLSWIQGQFLKPFSLSLYFKHGCIYLM